MTGGRFMEAVKKGQSTVEYIVLVALVVSVLIVFLKPEGGVFERRLNRVYSEGANAMRDQAVTLFDSEDSSKKKKK